MLGGQGEEFQIAGSLIYISPRMSPEIISTPMLMYIQIVSLTAQSGTPFSAVAEVHPAMVDPADAKGIKVPLCMLASGDEDAKAVSEFGKTLSVENHVETFGDQIHGWMAARGDLENEKVRKEYERGYQVLLDFYRKYL